MLSAECDPANGARLAVIADGLWREPALGFERTIFLFDDATLEPARAVWRRLGEQEGVERRYFAQEEGKWVQKAYEVLRLDAT